jgi:aminoglycoside phosphotransferase (APT) family kinase protein
VLIKRAAVEAEWPLTQSVDYWKNTLPVQRLRNEAASIQFIRQHTSIPVPNVVAAFADFDTYYVIQEKVQGVTSVDNVPAEHMHIITTQIDGFIEQMQRLRSPRFGGPGGDVCVPARFGVKDPRSVAALKFRENPANSFVFCHGDLNATNILIDPETYEIKCIIDWEYAGFYPPELEGRWWTRPGPAQPIGDERNDTQELLELLFGLATEESAAEARTWAEIGMRDLEKERQRFLDTQVPAVP